MAQYLKSLVTGVVLPYNEPALKCADIRLMEPAECEEYEASLGSTADPSPDVLGNMSLKTLTLMLKVYSGLLRLTDA
jgi:hypothetical protein